MQDEFAHRGCVMKNIPRFLNISGRSGEVCQGLGTARASPWVVVLSTTSGREHQQTEVEPTVPGFREGTVGSTVGRAEISSTGRHRQRRRGRDRPDAGR